MLTVTTYAELEELLSSFAAGHFSLLAIVGAPGLSKSQSLKAATIGRDALVVKGRKSALDFYMDLYNYRDKPVIVDDADDLLGQRLCREYLKSLTETDEYKRVAYGTTTSILKKAGVPAFFHTTSPVCIITNRWDSKCHIMQALESRAEIIRFAPTWQELYRACSEWFWDQEIFDYLHKLLPVLKTPDCRLLVKAYQRKKAGMRSLTWQALIDDHCDDKLGLAVRALILDPSFRSNTERANEFARQTGADRATFYRRLKRIREWCGSATPRVDLVNTSPPQKERPRDAII